MRESRFMEYMALAVRQPVDSMSMSAWLAGGLRMYQDGMSGGMHSDSEIQKGKSDGAVGLIERGVGFSGSDGDHVSVVIDDSGPGEAMDVIRTYTPS